MEGGHASPGTSLAPSAGHRRGIMNKHGGVRIRLRRGQAGQRHGGADKAAARLAMGRSASFTHALVGSEFTAEVDAYIPPQ